eukprot:8971859-Karenia_brevis.AAC.1
MEKPQVGCPGEEYPSCVSADTEDALCKEGIEEKLFDAGHASSEPFREALAQDVKQESDVQIGHTFDWTDTADVISINATISAKECPACSPTVIAPKRQLNCQTCSAMVAQGTCEACGLRNCRRCQRQCLRCRAFICIGCAELHADDCSAGHASVLLDITQVPAKFFDVITEDDKMNGFNASPMLSDAIECFAHGQESLDQVGRTSSVLSDAYSAGHEPVLFGTRHASPESFDAIPEDDMTKSFNALPVTLDAIECATHEKASDNHDDRPSPVLSDDCSAGREPVLFGICHTTSESFEVITGNDKIKGFNASPVVSDAIECFAQEEMSVDYDGRPSLLLSNACSAGHEPALCGICHAPPDATTKHDKMKGINALSVLADA